MEHKTFKALKNAPLHVCRFASVEAQAGEAATGNNSLRKPSSAQVAAGNYKLGRVTIAGLPGIGIENPRNSVRSGTDAGGKAWSCRMAAHYGYFAGTKGADGDGVDVFVGPFPESRLAWVINQRASGGAFDEHKCMVGFLTEEQARNAYLHSYSPGWTGMKSIVPASVAQLKWWLKNGDMSREFTDDQLPFEGNAIMDKVLWSGEAMPVSVSLPQLMYGLRQLDGDAGLLLDHVTMDELIGDPELDATPILDALVTEVGFLQRKMDQLLRVLQTAGDQVTASGFKIADPVKLRGALQVAVLFSLSDGQTMTIWFHNPDTTPARLAPMDELISWKWMLNKLDVTIAVAPERGRDLNVREVARRVMRLAEKNSEAFVKANAKAAEWAAQDKALDEEIAGLEGELARLNRQYAVAKIAKEDGEIAAVRRKRGDGIDPTTAQGYAEVMAEEGLQRVFEDALDPFFSDRILDVRNALRALGWEIPTSTFMGHKTVEGGTHSVEHQPLKAPSGGNINGVVWSIDGGMSTIRDDLVLTPEDLAAAIDASILPVQTTTEVPATEPVADAEPVAPVPVADDRTEDERKAEAYAQVLRDQGYGVMVAAMADEFAGQNRGVNLQLDMTARVEAIVGTEAMVLARAEHDPEGNGEKAFLRGQAPVPPEGLSAEKGDQWLAGWDAAKARKDQDDAEQEPATAPSEVVEVQAMEVLPKAAELPAPAEPESGAAVGLSEVPTTILVDLEGTEVLSMMRIQDDEGNTIPADKQVFDAAREYFRENIQGRTYQNVHIGEIGVNGRISWGKIKRGLTYNLLRVKLLAAIPALLKRGAHVGSSAVDKVRDDGAKSFDYLVGWVKVGDVTAEVGVSVMQLERGKYMYNLADWPSDLLAKKQSRIVKSGESPTDSALDSATSAAGDDANVTPDGGEVNPDVEVLDDASGMVLSGVGLNFYVLKVRGADGGELSEEPEEQATAATVSPAEVLSPIARVDAAYLFPDATDRFKAFIAETVDQADHSMFQTAKAADEAATAQGGVISWDVDTYAALDDVETEGAAEGEPVDSAVPALLDAAAGLYSICGNVKKDAELLGRVFISGEGRPSITKGSAWTGQITLRMTDIGPDDTKDLVGRLFVADVASNEPEPAPAPSEAAAGLVGTRAEQMPQADMTYRQVDDMFTVFLPETPAGEEAWKQMVAADAEGTSKVFNVHAEGVIEQLRAAGYLVEKAKDVEVDADELFRDLMAGEAEPIVASSPVDGQRLGDVAYLQSLIAGEVDMLDEGIFERLEPMFARYEHDEEMMALLNQAATAYSDATTKAAQAALA